MNEQTYYAVQITYPMPAHMHSSAFGPDIPEVLDSRFYTRATTYADIYLDLRKFAIQLATEAKEAALIKSGEFDVEPSFTLEELEALVSPTVCKIVMINNPSTTDAITTAIAIEERLGNVIEAMVALRPGEGMLDLRRTAAEFKLSIDSLVRDVITRHLYDNHDAIDLTGLDQAIDDAHSFLNGLRQTK
jgi:hypothetical protein